jgi:hypothetical protein
MKRMLSTPFALVAFIVLFPLNASAQQGKSGESPDSAVELQSLKRRVEELETQNRLMIQLLNEIKGRLSSDAKTIISAELRSNREDDLVVPTGSIRKDPSPTSDSWVDEPNRRSTPVPAQSSSNQSKAGSEALRWAELISDGNRIKFYGLLRLDLDLDSQRPNNGQIPFFISSEDPRLGSVDAESFSMHPRLTRFGIDFNGPKISALADAGLGGKLELDFENGGSESRQIIRIRHAYMNLKWKEFSILGGQTWDVVSPLFPTVNSDTLMWTAGNVGDRRPQFRVSFDPAIGRSQWSFTAAAGLMSAVDLQDLDNNGFRDGEESGRPNVQARVGYSRALWVKDQRLSLGVSGLYGWLSTSRPIANRTSFNTQLINFDWTIPLAARLVLRGEGWWGRNLSDIRGGAGQGINLQNGREIRGRGGWSEIGVKVSRYWAVHPGVTTDDPVDGDLSAGSRTRNRAFYFGNRITPGGNFTIGADYLRWRTDFKGFARGIDNRLNIFFQYGF